MPDLECKERLAVVETQVNSMREDFTNHREREEFYLAKHATLLAEIRAEQAKMKGFWGGMVFMLSAIATAASMFISKFWGDS